MNRKKLTLLVSTVCAVALLAITVVPAVAAPPKAPRAQFAATLQQLTEEGVINSEQAEVIIQRCGPRFGVMRVMKRPYQQRVKELALCQSRPILMRISQVLGMEASELVPQLREGKTVAEIAEEQGIPASLVVEELLIPVEQRLDRAVAGGRLSQEQAREKLSSAEVTISKMVHEGALKDIVGHQVNKIVQKDKRARQTKLLLHQVCQIVNLDHMGMLAELKEGNKIADIAEEQGISQNELLEELTQLAQDRLATAVSKGKLDAQKAEEIMQNIRDRLAQFVENFPPKE